MRPHMRLTGLLRAVQGDGRPDPLRPRATGLGGRIRLLRVHLGVRWHLGVLRHNDVRIRRLGFEEDRPFHRLWFRCSCGKTWIVVVDPW